MAFLADLKIAAARRVLNQAASLERELEVLRLLAAELSTTEIARELVITVGTVRNRLKSIYGKLEARNRMQAVEHARTLKLL